MKLTLGRKVVGVIIPFLVVISLATTTFLLLIYQRGMLQEIAARGTTMAESLARGVAEGIASENLGIIRNVQSIVQADDVILAQVYSSVWLPIDSYPDDNFSNPPDPSAVRMMEHRPAPCVIRNRDEIECYAPVFYHHVGQPKNRKFVVGYVRIKLSMKQVNARLQRHLLGYLGGSLVLTFIVFLSLNWLIRKTLLQPIEHLNRAVSAAMGSNSYLPVEVFSPDEIGQLTANFNRMLSAIQERERKLRQSQELFATAFRVSPDAVNITRLEDGRFLEINEGFTAMTGFTAEAVGRTSTELALWVDPEARQRLVSELKAQGVVTNLEACFRRKDGSVLTGSLAARSLVIGGEPCMLSITRDISEQKRADETLRKLDKLEAVGVLAGGIAHDFNNILTAIMGNISVARDSLDESHRAVAILDKAERAASRAAELAHTLLTFARGGLPVKRAAALRPILEESASLVMRGAKVLTILDLPDDLLPVEVDPGQISQVANNILINATQAMPEGGRITIRGENVRLPGSGPWPLPPGRYLRITLEDTGRGIPEENLGRVFDPYFTTKPGGSGLGLASAHSIISKHGGWIGVRSELGRGTTFEILLPASERPVAPEAPGTGLPQATNPTGLPVLVMDDEAMIRDLLTDMLARLGFQARTCVCGEDAVALYQDALSQGPAYSAVIMDLTIPGGMGGQDAAARILAMDPAARLIVSSGYSNDPVLADHQRFGFSATLMKPYSLAGIARTLGGLLPAPLDAAGGASGTEPAG